MTKIKKLIFSIMFLGLIISLSSCDFHFEKLFSSSDTKETTDSKEENNKDNETKENETKDDNVNTGNETEGNKEKEPENTGTGTDGNEGNTTDDNTSQPIGDKINEIIGNLEEEIIVDTPTDNEKTNEEELKIKDYLLDYTQDYGYQALANDPQRHGSDLQKIYVEAYNLAKEVLTSATNYEAQEINVTITDSNGTTSTVKEQYVLLPAIKFKTSDYSSNMNASIAASAVMEMIYDNPLFYYLNTGYLTSDESIQMIITYEYRTAEARTTVNNQILSMISDINDKYSFSTLSDYKKYESINKYIMDKIEYAYESDNTTPSNAYWAHNIEGLVNTTYSKGVCECYAKNFKLICDTVGLKTILATGLATSGGSSGGHAWNYAKLDDEWYGMDVTWNDSSNLIHKNGNYFLKGKSISDDHTPYNSNTYGISYRVDMPTLSENSYNHILF